MLEVLDRIHHERPEQARAPKTVGEMASEIAEMRGADMEYDERWRQIWSHVAAPNQADR
jgi:hypothetical protein